MILFIFISQFEERELEDDEDNISRKSDDAQYFEGFLYMKCGKSLKAQGFCSLEKLWKSHGKWFSFSRPGIVMELVKKSDKSH